ncbi:MAG TPA: NAD(P)/FAD-dependent oxidoreductase [Candidatus Dormibacteraeota bacterium]|nr:NAD(P)/FAD-dependent oxidoreductase [Candidatus Dormibacteraeota bacterium]
MNDSRLVVLGGGAAGFFAAITCAEAVPGIRVTVFEKAPRFLAKVRISGGGRCNVTHACFEPRELSSFYPRGGPALLSAFHRFQPHDTIEWFESRGVKLKTEADGRIFPVSDSSQTIIDCLMASASKAGVELVANRGPNAAERRAGGGFVLSFANGERVECDRLLLATGGCRVPAGGQLAASLGHTIEPPVPSLFTFHVAESWVRSLAGISVPEVDVSVAEFGLRERGPVLLTHAGLSGPAILRLSAWGARELAAANYRFPVKLNWLPHLSADALVNEFDARRGSQPARRVVNSPLTPLAARLWVSLVLEAGIPEATRGAELSRSARHRLIEKLQRTELEVSGKTLNQDEFVTCGGVRLGEVNFKTMESKVCPGLYFAGELLDMDGLTGGFNFQAAWTTGWIAGRAMGGAEAG